jgi:cation:H+ antiporter
MELLISLGLFFLSFTLLWLGSGLAVGAITKISHSLRMSSFFVSFFIMGLFTSLTEIMVGINAVITNQPEIFVGNLVGSSIVMFLLVVPLLAVLGNGVNLNYSFKFKDLVTAALVVGFPALLTLDNRITLVDVIICLVIYGYFVFIQEKNNRSLSKLVAVNFSRSTIYTSLAKILIAIVLVFFASSILVKQTTVLANYFGASPFIISILVISVGTNIPEISIAIRAILAKKKDIAFGNYLGSATLNTLELGLLGLISTRPIPAVGSNFSITVFLIGLVLFLYFAKSRNSISRIEGSVLILMYFLFVIFEIFSGPGWTLLK